jgi:hypothetical protein
MFWRRKPAYVEWDLVGSESSRLGADIFLSAAPMVIVHQINPVHSTYGGVEEAVEGWVASMPKKYRLNAEFEEFKSIARRFDSGESPSVD